MGRGNQRSPSCGAMSKYALQRGWLNRRVVISPAMLFHGRTEIMPPLKLKRIPPLKTVGAFAELIRALGVHLKFAPPISTCKASALTPPSEFNRRPLGNHWSIHPMEG